ncbi:hypothetical protein Nepgr_022704 [Nepenthes gracilis]|uniref:Uncharacterized protein n=1 Tax=Nepenthes gracilis TaxID=150966 RepID=A0AAD3XX21_NEPGR|nr:hypothetical protein Nepgr_022704 [Nepenthes gracilis]
MFGLSLNATIDKLEAHREASLLQYQQCLSTISDLESFISRSQEDSSKADKEAEDWREELRQLRGEKELGLEKYMVALGKIDNFDNELLLAEDDAIRANERADSREGSCSSDAGSGKIYNSEGKGLEESCDSPMASESTILAKRATIHLLREVSNCTREESEEQLGKAVNAKFETFISRKCVPDLEDKNFSSLNKCEKVLEALKLLEKLISELENEILEQQEESSLYKALDENQKLIIKKSVVVTLLDQLKPERADLKNVINALTQDFRVGNEQISSLLRDMQKLLKSNEELILGVGE